MNIPNVYHFDLTQTLSGFPLTSDNTTLAKHSVVIQEKRRITMAANATHTAAGTNPIVFFDITLGGVRFFSVYVFGYSIRSYGLSAFCYLSNLRVLLLEKKSLHTITLFLPSFKASQITNLILPLYFVALRTPIRITKSCSYENSNIVKLYVYTN